MARDTTASHKESWEHLDLDERKAKAVRLTLRSEIVAFPDDVYRGVKRSVFRTNRAYIMYLARCTSHLPFVLRQTILGKAKYVFAMEEYVLDEKIDAAVLTGYVIRHAKGQAPASLGAIDKRNVVIEATEIAKAAMRAMDFFTRRILTDQYGLSVGEGELLTPYDLQENAALEVQYIKLLHLDDQMLADGE